MLWDSAKLIEGACAQVVPAGSSSHPTGMMCASIAVSMKTASLYGKRSGSIRLRYVEALGTPAARVSRLAR